MREPRSIQRRTGRIRGLKTNGHFKEMIIVKKHGDPLRAMVPAMSDLFLEKDEPRHTIDWMKWMTSCRGSVNNRDSWVTGWNTMNTD